MLNEAAISLPSRQQPEVIPVVPFKNQIQSHQLKRSFLITLYVNKNVFVEITIQCGNFNWNKIRNLDIDDFCKKSQNRSIIGILCPYFGAYGFCISAPGSALPPLTFFFLMEGYAK
jgi:hypothetical protein